MMDIREGEVWFASFPLEDDNTKIKRRPVVVLDKDTLGVLSVKVTKHVPRKCDPYDIPILHWSEANLRFASTARVSKVLNLMPDDFIMKIGDLHPDDLEIIEELYIHFMDGTLPDS